MSDKIKFSELVKAFAESHNITQQKAENLVRGVFNLLLDDLENEGKASITNFGSFELKEVAERTGINPQTGEEIVIPAHNKVSFKPFKALEQTVNAPFAHLESRLIEEDPSESKPIPPVAPIDSDNAEEGDQEEFEDPFKSVISPEVENEPEDLDNEIEEEEEESEQDEASIPPPVYKARESEGNSGMVLLLIILLIAIIGAAGWYFFLRDSGSSDYSNQVADNEPPKTELPAPVTQEKPAEPMPESTDNGNNEMPAVSSNDGKTSAEKESALSEKTSETPKEMTTYIIKKDEWMWDISRKVYGKAYLWPLIFESNKKVTDNPNLVEPAKTLIIPRLEGNASALTRGDYAQLAKASRIVSEAYGNVGNQDRAAEYLRFSKKYERHSKN